MVEIVHCDSMFGRARGSSICQGHALQKLNLLGEDATECEGDHAAAGQGAG